MFQRAWDAGINFFDTANIYAEGTSEEITGDAALQLGYEQGLVGVTVQAVAQRAGVTKGGLFHHFRAKKRFSKPSSSTSSNSWTARSTRSLPTIRNPMALSPAPILRSCCGAVTSLATNNGQDCQPPLWPTPDQPTLDGVDGKEAHATC
jgi:hypothetical protein